MNFSAFLPWRGFFSFIRPGKRWIVYSFIGLVIFSWPAEAFLINEWEPLDLDGSPKKIPQTIQPGQSWRDQVSQVNLLWIPGGCFDMGSPPRAQGREMDEGPVHQKCVADFWLGETEVTQEQWRRVMHNNPAKFRQGDAFPVENVSWEEVDEFIIQLNKKSQANVRFRLPTEAEWEYACREGGQRMIFPGGTDPGRIAWLNTNSGGSTHEVKTRAPNRLGLKDMSGNVWEWMLNQYHSSYASHSPSQKTLPFHSVRGGGWQDESSALRCANRGFQSLTFRSHDLGLRLAASLAEKTKKVNEKKQA